MWEPSGALSAGNIFTSDVTSHSFLIKPSFPPSTRLNGLSVPHMAGLATSIQSSKRSSQSAMMGRGAAHLSLSSSVWTLIDRREQYAMRRAF